MNYLPSDIIITPPHSNLIATPYSNRHANAIIVCYVLAGKFAYQRGGSLYPEPKARDIIPRVGKQIFLQERITFYMTRWR